MVPRINVFRVGDIITLECIVTHPHAMDLGWVLDWIKIFSSGQKLHIGTNSRVASSLEMSAPGHFELFAKLEEIGGESLPSFRMTIHGECPLLLLTG